MTRFTLADIDRCKHGRHRGDACAGWRGPGKFDGGCQGGTSLGNPYWRMTGHRAGTTLYGEPVMTADVTFTAPPACEWAPLSHDAPALNVVTVGRPCGCDASEVSVCGEHLAWIRHHPEAERATTCPTCGAVAPLRLVAERRWALEEK